jgi:hypothetical protein
MQRSHAARRGAARGLFPASAIHAIGPTLAASPACPHVIGRADVAKSRCEKRQEGWPKRPAEADTEIIGSSQLYYALYGPAEFPHCGGPNEHPAIMAVIRAGKGDRAARPVAGHLRDGLQHTLQRKLVAEFQGLDEAFAPISDGNLSPRGRVRSLR